MPVILFAATRSTTLGREAPEQGPASPFSLEEIKAQIWPSRRWLFSDTTKTPAGPDPCWLDHGPQSWLLGRISSPFFPGSPPAPETRTGLEWPGHGSFWNCSGVFTDTKNLRTPLKLHPCLSEYLMIVKEIPGSITNLQWAFVLRKVSCRVPVTAQQ